MDFFPVVFITFKVLVLGTGMFFAVKWHHDQGKKAHGPQRQRALQGASGKLAALFVLALLVVLLLTFGLSRMLGLDLALT